MWVLLFFDLPSVSKKERKEAALFRKRIMGDGFTMFQFSMYIRHCATEANAEVHVRRVVALQPSHGKVGVFTITDRQFEQIKIFVDRQLQPPIAPYQQLEFL